MSAEVSCGVKMARSMARIVAREREAEAQSLQIQKGSRCLRNRAAHKKISASPTLAEVVGAGPLNRDELKHVTTAQVTQRQIEELITRWKKQYSVTYVSMCVRWLRRGIELTGRTDIRVPKVAHPHARTQIATKEECEMALAYARPALRLTLMLAMDSGLRYREATTLSPHNWNREEHMLTVTSKPDKGRTVPASSRVETILAALKGSNAYVQQLQPHKGKGTIRAQWTRLRKRLGITHLNLHDFRRTIATRVYTKTKDLRVVQALLGHENLSSTVVYIAPFDPHQLGEIMKGLTAPYRGEGPIQ